MQNGKEISCYKDENGRIVHVYKDEHGERSTVTELLASDIIYYKKLKQGEVIIHEMP